MKFSFELDNGVSGSVNNKPSVIKSGINLFGYTLSFFETLLVSNGPSRRVKTRTKTEASSLEGQPILREEIVGGSSF